MIKKAIELSPDDALILLGLGNFYYKTGKYEEAEKIYQKVISSGIQYVDAFYNLGVLYIKQKKYEKALKMIEKVLKIVPTHVDAIYSKGYILTKMHKYKEAKNLFQKVLEYEPYNEKAKTALKWIEWESE